MPKFSQESFSKLSTCHIDLRTIFFEVIKYFDCTILEGYRDEADQEADFKAGKTQLHWPNGRHNSRPSLAVDVAPYPVEFNHPNRFYWFAGYVMATAEQLKQQGKITHSLRYGGDWNSNKEIDDQTFDDLVHFELVI